MGTNSIPFRGTLSRWFSLSQGGICSLEVTLFHLLFEGVWLLFLFLVDHSEKVGMLPTPRLEWKCLDYWIRLWRLTGWRLGHPGKSTNGFVSRLQTWAMNYFPLIFHYTGWWRGILILVYCIYVDIIHCNPYKNGLYNPLHTLNNQGIFIAHMIFRVFVVPVSMVGRHEIEHAGCNT